MAIEKIILTKLKLDGKHFSKGVSDSKKDLIKLSATAIGVSAAIGVIAKTTANFQDKMLKAARTAGSSAESFTALSFAADLAAVGQENLVKSLAKLNAPTKAMVKELDRIGVSLKDATGGAKSQDKIIAELADSFKNMKSPVERSATAVKLFGQRGVELVNLFKDGSDTINKLKQEAIELGLVFSEEAGENAEIFNDNLVKLQKSFEGLSHSLGTSIIEFANQSGVIEYITDRVKDVIKWYNSLDKSTKTMIVTVLSVVVALTSVAVALAGIIAIAPAIKGALLLMSGPIGIAAIAVVGLVSALSLLTNSRQRFIAQAEKESQSLAKLSIEYEDLASKEKLTASEADRLRVAQKKLQQAAIASGVAFDIENSSLTDQVNLLKDLKDIRDAETKAKLAKIEAEINIQKEVFKTLQIEKKLGSTITTSTAKFLTQVEFFADTGVGLVTNVNSALKIAGKRLITLDMHAAKLKATLNPIVKSTRSLGKSFSVVSKSSNKATKQIKEMTDYLRNDFQKSLLSVNKDFDDFVKSVQADKRISKGFADVLIRQAAQKRLTIFNEVLEKEKQTIMSFNGEVLSLEERRILQEKKLALESLRNLYSQQEITTEEFNKKRLTIEEQYQSKVFSANVQAVTRTIGQITSSSNVLIGSAKKVTDVIVSSMKYEQAILQRDFEITLAKFTQNAQREIELTETIEQEKIDKIKSSFDEQIRAIEDAERKKFSILEGASNERLLLLDEEFQEAKRLAEEKYQQELERERLKFETDKELFLEKTLDKEQRQITELVLDEDFRLLMEALESAHLDKQNNMSKEFSLKQKQETTNLNDTIKSLEITSKGELQALKEKRDAEVLASEQAKNEKLTALEDAKTKKEKQMQKEQTLQVWQAEVAQFEATKAVKIAETIASTIAGASQAFAALAPIPFIGPALGVIAASLIIGAGTARVSQISSQKPIKPAALSLQKGGVLAGNQSHAKGGLATELESGEAVIDRVRTEKLISSVDSINSSGQKTFIFNFEENSIRSNDSIISDEMIERLSLMLSQRMEREGFAT